MKHLFITVLLILLLATPVAGFSGWGGSGWGGSGWGEEEVEEPEGVTPEEEPEEEVEEEPVEEVEEEPVEEEPPAPDHGITMPDTGQFLVDNGYAPSGFNSGWVEPAAVVYAPEPEVTIEPEVEAEPEILVEPIVITEKVIIYEPVYIEKEPTDNMQWWVEMDAPVEEKVEETPVVKRISTPETGSSGLFWLGLAAVILGVAIVARIGGG